MEHLINDLLPCVQRVNGFAIYPERGSNGFIFWSILPNRSNRKFCFAKLSSAKEFCKKYNCCHTEKFWLKLWQDLPFCHRTGIEQLTTELSYTL